MSFKKFKEYAVSFLFTQRCKYCGRVIDIRKEACELCENSIREIKGAVCFKCGKEKKKCDCHGQILFYEKLCAPYYYSGAIKTLIWRFKFRNKTDIADFLAEQMAKCVLTRYEGYDFDFVTYVPTTKKGIKIRGYNQAELLAKRLSEIIDIPCEEILVKNHETTPQHTLPEMKRTGNILGVFDVAENKDIEFKRILLCDDVKTTGATLNECAKTLLIGGAAEVFCVTAAITEKEQKETQDLSLN